VIVRPLFRSLSRPLFRGLSGAVSEITKVLIDLSPTSNGFYSLGTPQVFASDFEFEFYFVVNNATTFNMIFANSASDSQWIGIQNGGRLRLALTGGASLVTTLSYDDAKQHKVLFKRTGSTITVFVDGISASSSSLTNSDVITFDKIGTWYNNSFFFNGILSDPKLTDITTPANSLEFKLDQLTANTETNNGVTLTYQNIGTGNSVRDTYTLIDGDYLGSELVVNGNFATDLSSWLAPGGGWTYDNGKALLTGNGGAQTLRQGSIGSVGLKYLSSFDVNADSDIAIVDGSGSVISQGSVGNITGDFTQVLNAQIEMKRVSGVVNGTVDNVSVKRKIEVA
jgi:hypothetical protein